MKTNARPVSEGRAAKSAVKASIPPADAPMPTTAMGGRVCLVPPKVGPTLAAGLTGLPVRFLRGIDSSNGAFFIAFTPLYRSNFLPTVQRGIDAVFKLFGAAGSACLRGILRAEATRECSIS